MTTRPDRPDRETLSADLSAWFDGELSPAEAARLEAELARDPELRAERERLAAIRSDLRALPDLRAPDSVLAGVRRGIAAERRVRSPRFGTWAALFLVSAVCFVWWALEATRPTAYEGGLARREMSDAAIPESRLEKPHAAGLAESERPAGAEPAEGDAMRATELAAERAAGEERQDGKETLSLGDSRPRTPVPLEGIEGAEGDPRATARRESTRGAPPPGAGAVGAARSAPVGQDLAGAFEREDAAGAASAADAGAATAAKGAEHPGQTWSFGDRDEYAEGDADGTLLTVRVALGAGLPAGEIERLSAALARATAAPLEVPAGPPGANEARPYDPDPGKKDVAREDVPSGGDRAEESAGAAQRAREATAAPLRKVELPGEAGAPPPLPAAVEIEVPADRVLAAMRELRDWRIGLAARAPLGAAATGGDPASEPAADGAAAGADETSGAAAAGLAAPGGADTLTFGVSVRDGPSFFSDAAVLELLLADLLPELESRARAAAAASGAGAAAADEGRAQGGDRAATEERPTVSPPVRVRIVLELPRPEAPR